MTYLPFLYDDGNTITWTQHAIGQGGFHTGLMIDENSNQFSWIFDCGSRSDKRFNEYLLPWITRQRYPVDWLFISHFDFDHVSGLETLMSRCVVRNVMVPYVDDEELVCVLLSEIARGNLDRTLVDLIADPADFFLSRGATRVTFLNGSPPGELGEGVRPEPSEGPRSKDDRGWATRIDKQIIPLPVPARTRSASGPSPVGTIEGGSCGIKISGSSVGLLLKPYRAPIALSARKQLLVGARNLVGLAPTVSADRPGLRRLAYAIAQHARTAIGRAHLQALQKQHAGSSNRASLSLLSEPLMFNSARAWHGVRHQHIDRWWRGNGAWMNTGDAELLATADLVDWNKCYSTHLPPVRVLALPHHGSDQNSDGNLQKLCPEAILAAHAKSSNKKHPGPNVALAAGERLACVSEEKSSAVSMWFHSP